MKKNSQFIAVIFFVTLAFLIMLNDVRNYKSNEDQNTADLTEKKDNTDVVSTDFPLEE